MRIPEIKYAKNTPACHGPYGIRAEVIFGPPKSTYFLGSFPLVPPLDNLRKWPILVTLLNWPKLDTAGTFGAAVCAKMFSDDCALRAY